MRTFTPTPNDIERRWYVVDAEGKTLGRLASEVAKVLSGKTKPTYSPHMDVGDFVIVVNAEKVRVTGRKLEQKTYYRHSQYPGGLRSISLRDQLRRYPERVIQTAVKGMLPKNRVGRHQLGKLKVYAGESHPHEAQKPEPLEI
ncbi:MAG: 50S ribosomal protein L13 [Anaerolineae bacterium]|nr:50S ribosomal protein L13 [Anaerolineae bacterium]